MVNTKFNYHIQAQTLPDVCRGYVSEDPALVEFCASQNSIYEHMVNYTRLHEAIQLKSQPTHTRTLSAAEWLPCGLRYRPAVLFLQLHLTALSISKGKIQRAFKKLINSLLF